MYNIYTYKKYIHICINNYKTKLYYIYILIKYDTIL